jgi:CRP/FNR family cyclic AMP-dependent transcriptional regulator
MSDLENLFHMMRRMPIFAGLSDSTLALIIDQSATIKVQAGDHFFLEGEPASSFFVIKSGAVLVEKDWRGTPIKLRRLGIGDCIGEMSIIDLMGRSASVRAETDCQAIEIPRTTLTILYKQDLEQYAIIMMNMGREVSRRLRSASERLFAIEQTTPK